MGKKRPEAIKNPKSLGSQMLGLRAQLRFNNRMVGTPVVSLAYLRLSLRRSLLDGWGGGLRSLVRHELLLKLEGGQVLWRLGREHGQWGGGVIQGASRVDWMRSDVACLWLAVVSVLLLLKFPSLLHSPSQHFANGKQKRPCRWCGRESREGSGGGSISGSVVDC